MSAYVLDEKKIRTLTQATNAALRLNKKYSASYTLSDATVQVLGKYAGDLHSIYRALFITNIKAVNGRYKENTKTLPKFRSLNEWFFRDTSDISAERLFEACNLFNEYMYQIAEDPICGTPVFKAFGEIHGLLARLYVQAQQNKDCAGW